jgi:hypothetical protein
MSSLTNTSSCDLAPMHSMDRGLAVRVMWQGPPVAQDAGVACAGQAHTTVVVPQADGYRNHPMWRRVASVGTTLIFPLTVMVC